jgi:hypothetical protein
MKHDQWISPGFFDRYETINWKFLKVNNIVTSPPITSLVLLNCIRRIKIYLNAYEKFLRVVLPVIFSACVRLSSGF